MLFLSTIMSILAWGFAASVVGHPSEASPGPRPALATRLADIDEGGSDIVAVGFSVSVALDDAEDDTDDQEDARRLIALGRQGFGAVSDRLTARPEIIHHGWIVVKGPLFLVYCRLAC